MNTTANDIQQFAANSNRPTVKERVLEIIDNHLESCEEELNEVKIKFANCKLANDHEGAYEHRDKCNIIQGRQEILEVIRGSIDRNIS